MREVLHLDFLHPAPPRTWLTVAVSVLAALAIVGCLLASVSASREADRLAEAIVQSRRDSARELPSPRTAIVIDAKHLTEEVAEANAVIGHLATPWSGLFEGLERAADPAVVLTGLQPEAQGRRVRISGVARRFKDVLDYIGRLQDSRGLANVFLASHEAHEDASGVTIAFTVTCEWRDAP